MKKNTTELLRIKIPSTSFDQELLEINEIKQQYFPVERKLFKHAESKSIHAIYSIYILIQKVSENPSGVESSVSSSWGTGATGAGGVGMAPGAAGSPTAAGRAARTTGRRTAPWWGASGSNCCRCSW